MPPRFRDYRQHVDQLIAAALAAANPARLVNQNLVWDDGVLVVGGERLEVDGRLLLIAVGKAAVAMADAAADILGARLTAGIVISKQPAGQNGRHARLAHHQGDHPLPGPASLRATAAALTLLTDTKPDDVVLCLISGGTSALLTQPRLSLADWQALTGALLAVGCPIDEFNAVRRRLDTVKGGGLARAAAPARCVSLIISDVVGSPPAAIGSGPTTPTDDSAADVRQILERYDLDAQVETAVFKRILNALDTAENEERPPVAPVNVIIGDVQLAAEAAHDAAAGLGFKPQLLTVHLEGEAREVGRVAAALAVDTPPNHCLILGGETTVTLRGNGRGGRNQALALAAAIALDGRRQVALASFATDGEDGPTDAAGAIVTGETAVRARRHGLDPQSCLADDDSYTFFQRLDAAGDGPATHLKPGPTGTNVNDLVLILSYSK